MKILMVDKYYFIKGGAERYFFELKDILEAKGHKVIPFSMRHPNNFESLYDKFFVDNIDFELTSPFQKARAFPKIAGRMLYSFHAKKRLEKLLAAEKPDIAHLHMIDHQISPSILHTLKKHGIPVIQTLHQYKLVCPNYRLYNPLTNQICEKCLDGHFYHPIFERCHKDSRLAGALIAFESYAHRLSGMYDNHIDLLHTPSRFLGAKLKQAGVGDGKVRHLFYTLNLKKYPPHFGFQNYIVYFGRLAKEKGVLTLLKAMRKLKEVTLRIIGDGPERPALEDFAAANQLTNVIFDGIKNGAELAALIQNSKFVVIPSEWYDNSPLVIYESFAYGKPVIGTRLGGIPELIDHDQNGRLYHAGNHEELAESIDYLWNRPQLIIEFGHQARSKAEMEFEPEHHYQKMYAWYNELLSN